ncbi:MAG TPA: hypothetical protein VG144_13140 [Gaiellaceae bacterium]|nr:hypothetical protein [Gaiellaceae bacterium]
MTVLATIRPDDWNFPLLVHLLGAMLLVGGLLAAVTALLLGWRRDAAPYSRLGFWSLLLIAFPAWWMMRIGGQWIYSKEGFEERDEEPAWIGIGFITAELGGLLLLIAIILTGIGMRRVRRPDVEKSVLVQIGGVLATLVLLAYTLAMWAMTAKPD